MVTGLGHDAIGCLNECGGASRRLHIIPLYWCGVGLPRGLSLPLRRPSRPQAGRSPSSQHELAGISLRYQPLTDLLGFMCPPLGPVSGTCLGEGRLHWSLTCSLSAHFGSRIGASALDSACQYARTSGVAGLYAPELGSPISNLAYSGALGHVLREPRRG